MQSNFLAPCYHQEAHYRYPLVLEDLYQAGSLYGYNDRVIICAAYCIRWNVVKVKPESNSSPHTFFSILLQHAINPLLLESLLEKACGFKSWIMASDEYL